MRPWSPAGWPNTVLVITYDEWGGFFDRLPPPAAPMPPADQAAGHQDGLRGFRVPAFVISPWMPRGTVGHGLYDHTSVLRLIEWRWDLPPLTVRDATANNLADLLDFSHPGAGAAPCPGSPGPLCGPRRSRAPGMACATWPGCRVLHRLMHRVRPTIAAVLGTGGRARDSDHKRRCANDACPVEPLTQRPAFRGPLSHHRALILTPAPMHGRQRDGRKRRCTPTPSASHWWRLPAYTICG